MTSGAARNGTRWTAEALLAEATRVFAESGFHAATMNEVARRSTATKATYYNRFGSKDDLYEACLRREADLMRAHLFGAYEAVDGLGVTEQLRHDMLAFFEYAERNPAGYTLLFGPESAGPASRMRRALLDTIRDEVTRRVRRTLDARVPDAVSAAEMIAAMIVGVAVHGTEQGVVVESLGAERAGAMAAAFVVAALRTIDPAALVAPGEAGARSRGDAEAP
ncbi:TetR/AcrR family transcriptional regulator [Pseudonocardia alni]|uniref:AcrR family transcriptional regulator n=1 Tax=Pseudonocardia alni TaxID=33907 RepID=A0A852W2N2_PSEA5|nr:TetR/AcrR family transcriptional regulator [Pseudonocardia antarctica]NYG01074.1 AcrR family transcriptional regulator [Pseudonocardia antarctica]